jgi:hypothetical protein
MRRVADSLFPAFHAVRPARLLAVLAVAGGVGLVGDWLRSEQRLVFSRPLPVFRIVEPSR